jgi:hypothetical protein
MMAQSGPGHNIWWVHGPWVPYMVGADTRAVTPGPEQHAQNSISDSRGLDEDCLAGLTRRARE